MNPRLSSARFVVAVTLVLAYILAGISAEAETIDFEGLADSTPVSNQYSSLGVTFSNAEVSTAGITLYEVDFPPHSGVNVLVDSGGFINGTFSRVVTSFGAYFTYSQPLTLTAYDATNALVGTAFSAFPDNTFTSGNPPNEFLSISFVGGISRFTAAGSSSGDSFVLDDFQFSPASPQSIPEPGTFALILIGMTFAGGRWAKAILRYCSGCNDKEM